MKIQSVSNFNNPFRKSLFANQSSAYYSQLSKSTQNSFGDIISFRAKKYDIDSIISPTNHCAYCGCKVYSEAQIEALAKSMLSSKSHRLQGDIKSVLEKLESAFRSEELTFAKKIENHDEIDFFRKFLKFAEDKSFLKGEAIFEQIYHLESDDAFEVLKRNMRPLTRTVDHVSPQNLEEENNNSDINLVEACYCCNHDLKKGMSFPEFYAMFPSIKENMPPEKFQYAHSNLMSSSASSILNRMSATNLLKYVQRLFGQREETVSRLGSIDFRIVEANSSVLSSIQNCKDEIDSKQIEISELQRKLDVLSSDDEYQSLITRIKKINQLEQIKATIQSLRERRNNISSALNDLRNPPKKSKKISKNPMTEEEKEEKIQEYKATIAALNSDIETQEERKDNIELELMELNERFPTLEMIQSLKNKIDGIIAAHIKLENEKLNFDQLNAALSSCRQKIIELEAEITKYPNAEFNPDLYSEEEQAKYQRYISLVESLKYIEAHSSGNGIKSIINLAAKKTIDSEIAELTLSDIVLAANNSAKRKELKSEIDSLKKQEADIEKQINISQNSMQNFAKIIGGQKLEDLQKRSLELAADIRRLNDKQSYLRLPDIIASLKAEVILLQSTIKDLGAKQKEIEALQKG